MRDLVLKCVLELKDSLSSGLARAGGSVSGFARTVGANLMNIKAGFDMAFGAVSAVAGKLAGTLREAFSFETQTIQFAVLMRSMSAAKERMAELAKFAAETPFQMGEIVQASRTLHVFTGGILGASASLRLVGDTAAAVGANINDLGFWIGRIYAAIKGGQPFGEATMRLMELGVITPEIRTKMEDLQAAGASNAEIWSVLETRLASFSGGMKTLSETGDGLTSTLKDNWTEAVRSFGQALEPIAKTEIKNLIESIQRLNSDGTVAVWATRMISALESIGHAAGITGRAIAAVWNYSGASDVWSLGKGIVGGTVGIAADIAKGNFGQILANKSENVMSGLADGFYARKFFTREASRGDTSALNALQVSQTGKEEEARRRAVASAIQAVPGKTPAQEEAEARAKVAADLASAQKEIDRKRIEETAKKEAEARAKALKDEEEARRKMAERLAAETLQLRKKELTDQIEGTKQEESAASARLSAAREQASRAWGWYRDRDSLKAAIAEEKANAVAEKQFQSDFSRLQSRRSDWRSAVNLSLDDEAVKRVGLAREQERRASEDLRTIAENTRDLAKKLDELLTLKEGA